MMPTAPTADRTSAPAADDGRPRFFLDDAFDASADGDWWLDLGRVDVPSVPAV